MSITELILHVNANDAGGGAAIAARRLVEAQRAAGMDARMLVADKTGSDSWIDDMGAPRALLARLLRAGSRRTLGALAHADRQAMRTLALVSTGIGAAIQRYRPTILHYHWMGAEAASLAEFVQPGIPIAWTCHDQWAFCGVEHYASDDGFIDGYANRCAHDADRFNIERKRRIWQGWRPTLVCPSSWMERTANESLLAREWPKVTIANTLDTEIFKPIDRSMARDRFELPQDGRIVLFGAVRSDDDPRKGADLLRTALQNIGAEDRASTSLVTFGGAKRETGEMFGIKCRALGPVNDEAALAALYNAADVFVAPSRQDNLPNTMVEALCCGTPCVGFDIGGLRDIIQEPWHGKLVPPFDTSALGAAIMTVSRIDGRERNRADALSRFGNSTVVAQHQALYRKLLNGSGKRDGDA